MDHFILRGFCQDCEGKMTWHIWKGDDGKEQHGFFHDNYLLVCDGKPVWALSSAQIKILLESKEYWNWLSQNGWGERVQATIELLEREPFLIAKILKEAERKEAINNLKKLPKKIRNKILKEIKI